jgi:hypothetical protein
MKVGNIFSRVKISVSDDFNVVNSMDKIIDGLPTLIIGWDYVHKHYPDYDIFDKKLSNNLYWTYKSVEKRDSFEEDLYYFTQLCYNIIFDKVKYYFIDPFTIKKKTLHKIIRKVSSITNLITYKHDEMLYVYADNFMLGINLEMVDYIGLNKYKLTDKIKQKSYIFLDKDVIFIEYKTRIEKLGNRVKLIPILYSIDHG